MIDNSLRWYADVIAEIDVDKSRVFEDKIPVETTGLPYEPESEKERDECEIASEGDKSGDDGEESESERENSHENKEDDNQESESLNEAL